MRIDSRAPARLQAEERAAVPHQVELHVASAPVGLEIALALAVRHAAPALDDRRVGRQEGVADRAHHREAALEAASLKSSKKVPPMPRGSLRCLRKK